MIEELDTVVLTRDLPEQKLRQGDLGAVVLVHRDGAAYEVEFVSLGGDTLAVITLPADFVRVATAHEIAHAREVDNASPGDDQPRAGGVNETSDISSRRSGRCGRASRRGVRACRRRHGARRGRGGGAWAGVSAAWQRRVVVSGFSSLPEEFRAWPLLRRLHGEGHALAMPVMQGKSLPLIFRAWAPGDAMDKAVWGIAEPKADKPALEPDIVLVPLLAFDAAGRRLGYGGGYYDRTLRGLRARKTIVAVGLAYDE